MLGWESFEWIRTSRSTQNLRVGITGTWDSGSTFFMPTVRYIYLIRAFLLPMGAWGAQMLRDPPPCICPRAPMLSRSPKFRGQIALVVCLERHERPLPWGEETFPDPCDLDARMRTLVYDLLDLQLCEATALINKSMR